MNPPGSDNQNHQPLDGQEEQPDFLHFNHPGMSRLHYRLGRHAQFLRRMISRLHSQEIMDPSGLPRRPLEQLSTSDVDDPAIGLLDAWAMVCHVLAFYQERIAAEGYLRPATERRSILELARSITYELNPGVSASAYLAFKVDEAPGAPGKATVPQGTMVLSIPGQGEKPQTFETGEEIEARAEWNAMRPQLFGEKVQLQRGSKQLYLKGVKTGLRLGDPILLVDAARERYPGNEQWDLRILTSVEPNARKNHTLVTWEEELGDPRVPEYDYYNPPKIFALRQRTSLFGFNAPPWHEVSEEVQRKVIEEIPRGMTSVAIFPESDDGQFAVAGGVDGAVIYWNLAEGEIWSLQHHHEAVNCVAYVPHPSQSLRAVSGGEDGTLKLWDMVTSEVLHSIRAVRGTIPVLSLAVTPNGSEVLTGYGDGRIRRRNGEDLARTRTIQYHDGAVSALAISDSGDLAVSGGADGLVKLWRFPDEFGKTPHTYRDDERAEGNSHQEEVTCVAFAMGVGEQGVIISGSADKTLKVWNVHPDKRGWPPIVYDGHIDTINAVTTVSDGIDHYALSAGAEGSIHLWKLDDIWGDEGVLDADQVVELTQARRSYYGHTDQVNDVVSVVTENQHQAVSVGADRRLVRWEWDVDQHPGKEIAFFRRSSSLEEVSDWPNFFISSFQLDLETTFPKVLKQSWVALMGKLYKDRGVIEDYRELYRAESVSIVQRSDYTLSGRITRIGTDTRENQRGYDLRTTVVFAQNEQLEMAHVDEPLPDPLKGEEIHLERYVPGLDGDRKIVFSGRRARARVAREAGELELTAAGDTGRTGLLPESEPMLLSPPEDTPGGRVRWHLLQQTGFEGFVTADGEQIALIPSREEDPLVSEVAHLAGVKSAGGKTVLILGGPLKAAFDPATLIIHGNVVQATHGESIGEEVLGSGESTVPNQEFRLKRPPLTYVPAAGESGGAAELEVRVNGVLWKRLSSLFGLQHQSENYMVRHDNEANAFVIFGDGKSGARLPTGVENIVAAYRTGIGLEGLVGAGSLQLLKTKPLGIRGVSNPLPASGAADPESMERARVNAPRKVLTLDRTVSLQDFENFARGYAGIGKAQAREFWDGETRLVHITVAAVNGGEVPPDSALSENLLKAIAAKRETTQEVRIASYQTVWFELQAGVSVDARYKTEVVKGEVEAALWEAFSFDRREFAQPVTVADVISVVHEIAGVVAVDVNDLYPKDDDPELYSSLRAKPARWEAGRIEPAQLLLLSRVVILPSEVDHEHA